MDCVFCIPKEIEKQIIHETEHFYALYDIKPVKEGHVLIIPKKHTVSYLDLSEDLIIESSELIKKFIKILLSLYKCTGFNLSLQEGEDAGQSVPHLHWHIIPRKKDDLEEEWYVHLQEEQRRQRLSPGQIQEHIAQIKRYV